jgi:hypothetical protein
LTLTPKMGCGAFDISQRWHSYPSATHHRSFQF